MRVDVQTQIGFDVPAQPIEQVLHKHAHVSLGTYGTRHTNYQLWWAYALDDFVDVVLEGGEQVLSGLVDRCSQERHHILQSRTQILHKALCVCVCVCRVVSCRVCPLRQETWKERTARKGSGPRTWSLCAVSGLA
jgi:hypothetical protein